MKDEKIINNLGLIHKVIKDLNCVYRNDDEYDRFYYAGLFGLITAIKTFDEEKGNSTYLYNAIKYRIISVFNYNSNPRRYNGTTEISLNTEKYSAELQDYIVSDYNLEKEVINKIYVEYLLGKLKNKRYKKFIIEYYGINCPALNMREIAQKYGICQQNVSQAIKRGLWLLRKEIE
jgi:RNA polymerase sigma factor (sigma-70 family)